MKTYYDTGILLKLYLGEAGSEAVQQFVQARGENLAVTELHVSECVSAMKLRAYRKECLDDVAMEGIGIVMEDLASGVLKLVEVDWPHVWQECRLLSEKFAWRQECERSMPCMSRSPAFSVHVSSLRPTRDNRSWLPGSGSGSLIRRYSVAKKMSEVSCHRVWNPLDWLSCLQT